MLLEWKISECPHSSELTSKRVKVNKDFLKGVNPNSLSDKLSYIDYFIRMYSLPSNLTSDLKAKLYYHEHRKVPSCYSVADNSLYSTSASFILYVILFSVML